MRKSRNSSDQRVPKQSDGKSGKKPNPAAKEFAARHRPTMRDALLRGNERDGLASDIR